MAYLKTISPKLRNLLSILSADYVAGRLKSLDELETLYTLIRDTNPSEEILSVLIDIKRNSNSVEMFLEMAEIFLTENA